jgi:intracellular septation protein
MKAFLDFFPVVLFFIVFKWSDVFTATAVAIAATVLQIVWLRYKFGKVETMQWVSLGVIVVFGGATLISHDETFIKFKPSVLYLIMALALWVGEYGFGRNFLKQLMSSQIEVLDPVWRALVNAWGVFFLSMSVLNLWVAYNFDTDTWVNFKMFGGMGLMFVFVLGQALYLAKHMKPEDLKGQGLTPEHTVVPPEPTPTISTISTISTSNPIHPEGHQKL